MSRTERGWDADWLAQQIERGHQRWQRAPHVDKLPDGADGRLETAEGRQAHGPGPVACVRTDATFPAHPTSPRKGLSQCPGAVVATREDTPPTLLRGPIGPATAAGAPNAKPQNGPGSTPRPFKLSTYTVPESDVLKAVLLALRLNPRVAWAYRFNSGAYKVKDERTGKTRFIHFGFPGCPDIMGQLNDGRTLAVEVKRRDGTVTEAQAEFLGKVERAGGMAFVARDVADVIARLGI